MSGENRTEKPTPKRRGEARKRGQVARSADLQGAVVLLVALLALSAFGPALAARLEETLRAFLAATATPDVVRNGGLGALLGPALASAALAVAPIALACLAAGVAASTAQVGLKPSAQALKPDPRRLDPLQRRAEATWLSAATSRLSSEHHTLRSVPLFWAAWNGGAGHADGAPNVEISAWTSSSQPAHNHID